MEFVAYLDQAITAAAGEVNALNGSARQDEANLAKVKLNILNVCKTIFETFVRVGKSDDQYLAKLDELRQGWDAAREQAAAYHRTETAVIEGIKLDTLAQVRGQFLSWKENTT